MSYAPARILGINKGTLSEGKNADIVIIDENKQRIIDKNSFYSKSKNTPYHGYKLSGTVEYTIVGGKFAVREGILI
jgi:dihydroorotase